MFWYQTVPGYQALVVRFNHIPILWLSSPTIPVAWRNHALRERNKQAVLVACPTLSISAKTAQ